MSNKTFRRTLALLWVIAHCALLHLVYITAPRPKTHPVRIQGVNSMSFAASGPVQATVPR